MKLSLKEWIALSLMARGGVIERMPANGLAPLAETGVPHSGLSLSTLARWVEIDGGGVIARLPAVGLAPLAEAGVLPHSGLSLSTLARWVEIDGGGVLPRADMAGARAELRRPKA